MSRQTAAGANSCLEQEMPKSGTNNGVESQHQHHVANTVNTSPRRSEELTDFLRSLELKRDHNKHITHQQQTQQPKKNPAKAVTTITTIT